MIDTSARPQLSPKVRLRFDRQTGRYILLYPERGLELNKTATAIASLCTGEYTAREIADLVARIYAEVDRSDIERAVYGFLVTLGDRGLLRGIP
jgi:coenzyme PQQ biosynthesis protein PqqD